MRAQSGYVSGGEWHERPDRCDQCDCSDCCEAECGVGAGAPPAIVAGRYSASDTERHSDDDSDGDPYFTSSCRS
jgi:hypothetical protein